MLPKNYKESLICLENACKILNFHFEYADKDKILAKVVLPSGRLLFFMHNKNPFNDLVSAQICKDKALQYELLDKEGINQPKTFSYFNPLSENSFSEYKTFQDINQVKKHIISNFDYPFVLKKHDSSLAKDVYLVSNQQELNDLLEYYFQPNLFCILLAQEYLKGTEYRVISFDGEVLLTYNKSQKFQTPNKQVPKKLNNQDLLKKIADVIAKIQKIIPARFLGTDLFVCQDGSIKILELNSNPACFYYNEYNGRADFTEVYLKCLQRY